MLQIKNIKKEYHTGNLTQKALDGVSLNLRDNEFVAILGQSGSGKTTLLNIIGGLDRYDSGDLIINGVSTKKYKDRDWDSYRNHTIGFVFQSYNLIMHQTVLSNVELALTISGISGAERRKRAEDALRKVGLGDHMHKKPNQMSGGQMQRVAIARALVNDPDIVLADEPTGALDSETSIQVMDLLKEVAKDRLVVMVTHNPELAYQYATRIVTISDGKIKDDSDPFVVDEKTAAPAVHKNLGKASMSFLTALSLSFNNLRTKKARTFMVAFAGSIGIIGIALILALSSGVNKYIDDQESETLAEYPLQIEQTGYDLTSLMTSGSSNRSGNSSDTDSDSEVSVREIAATMFDEVSTNDLRSLRKFFESGKSDIYNYVKAIEYTYDVTPQIYREDEENNTIYQLNPNTIFGTSSYGGYSIASMMSSAMSTSIFSQLPEDADLYKDSYDIKAGKWPESADELVLVLSSDGSISDVLLYEIGVLDITELQDLVSSYTSSDSESTVTLSESADSYGYDEFIGQEFKLVYSTDYYTYDETYGVWTDRSENSDFIKQLVSEGEELTIVGVVQPKEDVTVSMLSSGIGYTYDLTMQVMEQAADSEVVQAQIDDPEINIFTGVAFDEETGSNDMDMSKLFSVDEEALANAFNFDTGSLDMSSLSGDLSGMDLGSIDFSNVDLSSLMSSSDTSGLSLSEEDLAAALSGIKIELTDDGADQITALLTNILSGYESYAEANGKVTVSGLGSDLTSYLGKASTLSALTEKLNEIISESGVSIVTQDDLVNVMTEILEGYVPYLQEQYPNQQITTEMLTGNLRAYLQSDAGTSILNNFTATIQSRLGQIFTSEKLSELTDVLVSGYMAEVAAGTAADPSQLVSDFTGYLNSSEAQSMISGAASKIIKTDVLAESISGSLNSMMGAYSSAMSTQISSMMEQVMGSVMSQISSSLTSSLGSSMSSLSSLSSGLESMFSFDSDTFASAISMGMDASDLTDLMTSMMSGSSSSYEGNLAALGYAEVDNPYSIDIYSKDFDSKEEVTRIIDEYNTSMEEAGDDDKVITYTDIVGTMMTSVTSIINAISYVLIAFVGISLVVSSIMIGVITYISVLERRKEIGILRAMGASKGNIGQVFNAETFITGALAGTIGVVVAYLLTFPINMIIERVTETSDIKAILPLTSALALVLLSIVLTVIAGLLPSRKASKSDPVTALRTE